jgi:hypothetical protein
MNTSRITAQRTQVIARAFSAVIIAAAATCYVFGLLIVNLWLSSHGLHSLELARADYVLTGAAYLFLVALSSVACRQVAFSYRKWKQKREYRPMGLAVVYVAGIFSTITVMSGHSLGVTFSGWGIWLGIAVLIAGAISSERTVQDAKRTWNTFKADNSAERNAEFYQSQIASLLNSMFVVVLVTAGYACFVYPVIGLGYGGSNRAPVVLIAAPGGAWVAVQLGLPVNNNAEIGPVRILAESEIELFVLRMNDTASDAPAIRLDRRFVEGMRVLKVGDQKASSGVAGS